MRLVIIGNGMAATRLIASLTGSVPGRFAVTVIGDEPEQAYNRIQLSPVLGGEKQAEHICLHDEDWYTARGVTVLRGEKALAVDVNALFAQIARHDLVLDCTDNVAIRNQLNAGCFAHKTPLISGAAIRMEGQITVFTYAEGEPCYRCLSRLFGENALTCVEAGVMAPLVGVIGSLQAMEAIKVLAHYGTPAAGKIVMYDAMTCQFREMKLMRNPGCEVCSQ